MLGVLPCSSLYANVRWRWGQQPLYMSTRHPRNVVSCLLDAVTDFRVMSRLPFQYWGLHATSACVMLYTVLCQASIASSTRFSTPVLGSGTTDHPRNLPLSMLLAVIALVVTLCMIATILEGGVAMTFAAITGLAVHLATMVGSRVEDVILEDIAMYYLPYQRGVW